MDTVRVGILGCGFWGKNHARVFRDIKAADVVAVCDIQEERAKSVADNYRIPRVYANWRQLVGDKDVEAVTICTPSVTHYEMTTAAIEQEKPVLVEKPMAMNPDEAIKIVEMARDKESIVMVGFIERFNPAVQLARNLVVGDEIGRVLLSYSRRIGSWPERIGDVGVVKDTAIHDIDLSLYFFEEMPESVYAAGGSIKHRLEDHVQALLSFTNERSSIIEANWLTPRKKREMHITGADGVIRLDFLTQEVAVERNGSERRLSVAKVEPLKAELEHFVECADKSTRPIVNEVDGYRAMMISDAILTSVKTKEIVTLSKSVIQK